VAALKAAVTLCGFDVGPPTAPMTPCTEAEIESIGAILSAHRPMLTFSDAPLF
jgi:dihydrodipicolinate synthase/N-acetylneuraminate lyase